MMSHITPPHFEEVVALAKGMPRGHDLTSQVEHEMYLAASDKLVELYRDNVEALKDVETVTTKDISAYPTIFHIAVKNALSKLRLGSLPKLHCTVVFAMYGEQNRMVPCGTGEGQHPNGEDFVRRKHQQMTWLFAERPDCSWSMIGSDDGCPTDSAGLCESIIASEGYGNVRVVRLLDAANGTDPCPALTPERLNAEPVTEEDKQKKPDGWMKLVKASQKGGAIIYGLWKASQDKFEDGREHAIVYTDSDLSTDLRQCGLNLHTMLGGPERFNCSISERFGIPNAVNCSAKTDEGVVPGLARDSIVHLTLRHKLRRHLLPPLTPIVDSQCGHKGVLVDAVVPILSNVRDLKGSFDMDWLIQLGLDGKKKGQLVHGVTPVAWVASVAESNFWGGGGGKDEDPAAARLKTMTSWFKIFHTMAGMSDGLAEEMKEYGISEEDAAWAAWVRSLTVESYASVVDSLVGNVLKGKTVLEMPEPAIMGMDLETIKSLAGPA